MAEPLDRARLLQAFELLGAHLAGRGLFVELAVYGGSALVLQFSWRRSTRDVDAVVRDGYDERILAPSVDHVAERMGLERDWLNDAVGMFTPLDESDVLFECAGAYPAGIEPGLRTFVAKPCYLLAMKLQALRTLDRGDRDLKDARALAAHLGIAGEDGLTQLYLSIYGEPPPEEARDRFPAVLAGDRP